jgi:hypothetical protein
MTLRWKRILLFASGAGVAGVGSMMVTGTDTAAQIRGQKVCTAIALERFTNHVVVPPQWTARDCSDWVIKASGTGDAQTVRYRLGCIFDGGTEKFSYGTMHFKICSRPGALCAPDSPKTSQNSIPIRNCGWSVN